MMISEFSTSINSILDNQFEVYLKITKIKNRISQFKRMMDLDQSIKNVNAFEFLIIEILRYNMWASIIHIKRIFNAEKKSSE